MIVFCALLAVISGCLIFLMSMLSDTKNEYFLLEKQIISADGELKAANERLLQLEKEREELSEMISNAEKTSIANYEKEISVYREQLAQKDTEIAQKQSEIEELNKTINELGDIFSMNINEQFSLLTELENKLENERPTKWVKVEPPETEGNDTDNNVPAAAEYTEAESMLAVYYYDIENGYTFEYNGDVIFDSASIIKAPMALSILQAVEADPEKYDLTEKIVYEESMYQKGSGSIKNSEIGKEYTFLELFEYMLDESDNVAFYQIKDKFGYSFLRAFATEHKLDSMRRTLAEISAKDAGKVMLEIYNYINGENEYSELVYESMCESSHTVLIPYAVRSKTTIHKYGWDTDAYHDMAVVYDEHPYIVVVLSNFDQGGTEIDKYLRSIIQLIDKMHNNFYNK